jgi:hypothetical protein
VTPAKHQRPSLTTAQFGSRLRLANPAIEAAQKLVTRRSFSRTGFPAAVVSTAAMNGVLPGASRPRLPPRYASSILIRPVRRLVASRSA